MRALLLGSQKSIMTGKPGRRGTHEQLYCEEADEVFIVPKGTSIDLHFLGRCNIEPWDALHWITYMNGEHPFEMRDEDKHN